MLNNKSLTPNSKKLVEVQVEKFPVPTLRLSVASTLREVASTPTLLQLSPHSLTSLISIKTTKKVKVHSSLLVN
jgi:hypothetical protein